MIDERLKELLQELGCAINETLTESDRIAEAISEIKRAGYNVFLILEATMGINKLEFDEDSKDEKTQPTPQPEERAKWTTKDQDFLRYMRISTGEDDPGDPKPGS